LLELTGRPGTGLWFSMPADAAIAGEPEVVGGLGRDRLQFRRRVAD
jgi:hypothetical protein